MKQPTSPAMYEAAMTRVWRRTLTLGWTVLASITLIGVGLAALIHATARGWP